MLIRGHRADRIFRTPNNQKQTNFCRNEYNMYVFNYPTSELRPCLIEVLQYRSLQSPVLPFGKQQICIRPPSPRKAERPLPLHEDSVSRLPLNVLRGGLISDNAYEQ